jgi:3',5'-cyclic-nucleotide phosphodiesterase
MENTIEEQHAVSSGAKVEHTNIRQPVPSISPELYGYPDAHFSAYSTPQTPYPIEYLEDPEPTGSFPANILSSRRLPIIGEQFQTPDNPRSPTQPDNFSYQELNTDISIECPTPRDNKHFVDEHEHRSESTTPDAQQAAISIPYYPSPYALGQNLSSMPFAAGFPNLSASEAKSVGFSTIVMPQDHKGTYPGKYDSEVFGDEGLTVEVEAIARVSMENSFLQDYISRAKKSPASALPHSHKFDQRLNILFDLSTQFNKLHKLEDMLKLIVKATFGAFTPAQFFAIYLANNSGGLDEYFTNTRGVKNATDQKLVLSKTLLHNVAKDRETVLFVRDRHIDPTLSMIEGQIWSCLCAPLLGRRSLLGVMLVDTRHEGAIFTNDDLHLFSILASNAAFAIERSQLTEEIICMFDGFVEASVRAIEARDPSTAGHSERVASYAIAIAEHINTIDSGNLKDISFSQDELIELRYAALLHDFGKIGVSEAVLNKSYRISDERMELIRQRFNYIKASCQLMLQHKSLSPKQDEENAQPSKLTNSEREINAIYHTLDHTTKLIDKIRKLDELSSADLEKLEHIAQQKVTLHNGQSVSLLEADEIDNLRIRKGNLNDKEWEDMKSHATHSENCLKRIPWNMELKRVPEIAGSHHERLDGRGYPCGKSAEQLLPQSRLLSIADIFDALTALDRPYRKASTVNEACDILLKGAKDGSLDPDIVEAFIQGVLPKLIAEQPQLLQQSETHITNSNLLRIPSSGNYTLFKQNRFRRSNEDSSEEHSAAKSDKPTHPNSQQIIESPDSPLPAADRLYNSAHKSSEQTLQSPHPDAPPPNDPDGKS